MTCSNQTGSHDDIYGDGGDKLSHNDSRIDDSLDSDFSMQREEKILDVQIADQNMFLSNIDPDVEFQGYDSGNGAIYLTDNSEEDVVWDSDTALDSARDSDDENAHKFPVFNPVELYGPAFKLGMIFNTKEEIRKSIRSYAIKCRRNIKIVKNDKIRLCAKCMDEDCDWKLHAYKMCNEETYQIKTYVDSHRSYMCKNMKSSWLAGKYNK